MPKYCEIQCGQLEKVGTSVEVLGRTKIRTADAVLTLADPKHIEAIMSALNIGPKDPSEVPSNWTSCASSPWVKQRQKPTGVQWAAPSTWALKDVISSSQQKSWHATWQTPDSATSKPPKSWEPTSTVIPRFTKWLDAGITAQSELSLDIFTDSDWAGCLETRRSTDCYVVEQSSNVGHRSNLVYLQQALVMLNFVVFLGEPEKAFSLSSWQPAISTWKSPSQSYGPIQQARKQLQGGLVLAANFLSWRYANFTFREHFKQRICLGKCKGTYNPANFLTKHAKSGTEVRAALPSLGMLESESLDNFEKIDVKVSQVKPKGAWKPTMPSSIEWAVGNATRIRGVRFASSRCMASAQGSDEPWPSAGNWIIIFLMLIGCFQLATWFWTLVCSLCPDRMVNAEARRLRIPLAEGEPRPEVEIQPLPRRPRGDPSTPSHRQWAIYTDWKCSYSSWRDGTTWAHPTIQHRIP